MYVRMYVCKHCMYALYVCTHSMTHYFFIMFLSGSFVPPPGDVGVADAKVTFHVCMYVCMNTYEGIPAYILYLGM